MHKKKIMKRTILIPTDFSVDSLIPVRLAADLSVYTELEIVLMFCHHLPGSITDLMFYNPSKIIRQYNSPKFQEACDILINKYASKIKKIRIELFHGKNDSAFENFISGNKIDEIIYPKNYILNKYKDSFNPIPFIKKSFLPCREVEWQSDTPVQSASLSNLFLDAVCVTAN